VSLVNTDKEMGKDVADNLQDDLELWGVKGLENRLKKNVKPSLELLRNAGIKIWIPGDKVETARCAAASVKLVSKGRYGTSLPIVCPLLHYFCLQAVLTRVRLRSKTKRPWLQCSEIPPQQD